MSAKAAKSSQAAIEIDDNGSAPNTQNFRLERFDTIECVREQRWRQQKKRCKKAILKEIIIENPIQKHYVCKYSQSHADGYRHVFFFLSLFLSFLLLL